MDFKPVWFTQFHLLTVNGEQGTVLVLSENIDIFYGYLLIFLGIRYVFLQLEFLPSHPQSIG